LRYPRQSLNTDNPKWLKTCSYWQNFWVKD
jgi:hypothetical protein